MNGCSIKKHIRFRNKGIKIEIRFLFINCIIMYHGLSPIFFTTMLVNRHVPRQILENDRNLAGNSAFSKDFFKVQNIKIII